MKVDLTRVQPLLAQVRRRLCLMRHPTRRGVALSLAALPVLMLLYVLILIPFTPSIRNIEKAKVQQPAIVLSSDNVELAVFKRANRHWTKLSDISPHVVDALIAT
ncbi:MAG: penicillin-binding protein, partial [Rhodoferax sp.]